MTASPLRRHAGASGARLPAPRPSFGVDDVRMRRDAAPVVAAKVLLRHGLDDASIVSYLARSWPLDERDCRSALDAAHILIRREHAHGAGESDEERPRPS